MWRALGLAAGSLLVLLGTAMMAVEAVVVFRGGTTNVLGGAGLFALAGGLEIFRRDWKARRATSKP